MKLFDAFFEFIAKLVFFYEPKEEVYHKKITNKTTVAGFTVDDELVGKVLTAKYKNKNLPK